MVVTLDNDTTDKVELPVFEGTDEEVQELTSFPNLENA